MHTKGSKSRNRLGNETSPYLLQHKDNPVDWYPWGDEALNRARREQKPIFLSIGYSACHWCHVMEKESFENEETAKLMNELFINIKVDREERQDLDHIYMSAVQMMTQHGGWPMSVFLTPDLAPFYGGTYFPDEPRMGMPSFKQVLAGVSHIWKNKKDEALRSAKQVVSAIEEMNRGSAASPTGTPLSTKHLDLATQMILRNFDPENGGFGNAPKFFHSMSLQHLLRQWKRTGDMTALGAVETTLVALQRGGIYDQLGGGFHRYSTDAEWLAPHFEKMLYDNALLTDTYLEAFQATGNEGYAQTVRETLDYVLREMTSPEGGFYSTQDADSEGVEGKFFVWSYDEVKRILGEERAAGIAAALDITAEGNWEGHNILRRKPGAPAVDGIEIAAAKRKLFTERSERIWPQRDEKLLVAWNGLMIHSMARAHQILGDERYLEAGRSAAQFILDTMVTEITGKGPLLYHAYKDGRARFTAYLDDYASLVNALVTLYESDFDPKWIKAAKAFAGVIEGQFWDEANEGFFYTGIDHEKLITRTKDIHDGALPAGSSLAVTALLRLSALTGDRSTEKLAVRALTASEPLLRTIPSAMTQMLIALDFYLEAPKERVVITGTVPHAQDDAETLLAKIRAPFLPSRIVAMPPADSARSAEACALIPLLAHKPATAETQLFVCENGACQAPLAGKKAVAWAD